MPVEIPLDMTHVHELAGSPVEDFDKDSFVAARLFLLPWEMRYTFAATVMQVSGAIPAIAISYPGRTGDVIAEHIRFEPFLGRNSCPSFQFFTDISLDLNEYEGFQTESKNGCLGEITYRDFKGVRLSDGTYVEYSRRSSHQVLTIPKRTLEWLSDGVQLSPDVFGGLIDTLIEHQIKWCNVRFPPWDTISELHGSVNDDFFELFGSKGEIFPRGIEVPPECLMFDGSDARYEFRVNPNHEKTFEIIYMFKERNVAMLRGDTDAGVYLGAQEPGGFPRVTWNHLFREDTEPPQWDKPIVRGTFMNPRFLYQRKDFLRLFQQTPPLVPIPPPPNPL
jgi:hypothetical protein